MPRSVNAVASRARRKKIMKQAKGFFGRRKNVWTVAKNAVEKAMQYAYRGRKEKKRNKKREAVCDFLFFLCFRILFHYKLKSRPFSKLRLEKQGSRKQLACR